jgi:uncharacterized protein YjbI with pentapeptide repeats
MRVLHYFLGFCLALLLWVQCSILPAQAASSAAIRAYDDFQTSGQDYSGHSLVQAEFIDAKLKGANFSGADLRGAVFNGAILSNANLHGADLSDAIAYITDLSGADLSDAIFTSAMLLKTNFKGANITGADFTDAAIDREQIILLCRTASGVNSVTGVETRESLGCR